MAAQNTILGLSERDASKDESDREAADFMAYHALLFDELVITMLVDRQGRLVSTSYSIVSAFTDEVIRGATEEVATYLDLDVEVGLGAFGSDMREETAEAMATLVGFREAVAIRAAELADEAAEPSPAE